MGEPGGGERGGVNESLAKKPDSFTALKGKLLDRAKQVVSTILHPADYLQKRQDETLKQRFIQAGISQNKVDSALRLVRHLEEHVTVKTRKDDREVERSYRFNSEYDDIKYLKNICDHVDDPFTLYQTLAKVINFDNLELISLDDRFGNLAKIPNIQEAAEKLSNISALQKESFYSIEIKESEDGNSSFSYGRNFPYTEPITALAQMEGEKRQNLLQEDSIKRINFLVADIAQKKNIEIGVFPGAVLPLLEIASNSDLFHIFSELTLQNVIKWPEKNSYENQDLIDNVNKFLWIHNQCPFILELHKKGFDTFLNPIFTKFFEKYSSIHYSKLYAIDLSTPQGRFEFTKETHIPIKEMEETYKSSDTCKNAEMIYKELGIRVNPWMPKWSFFKEELSGEKLIYEEADPHTMRKITMFLKHAGKQLGVVPMSDKDGSLLYNEAFRTMKLSEWEKILKSFQAQDFEQIFLGITDAVLFPSTVDSYRIKDFSFFVVKTLLKDTDKERIKIDLEALTSFKFKIAMEKNMESGVLLSIDDLMKEIEKYDSFSKFVSDLDFIGLHTEKVSKAQTLFRENKLSLYNIKELSELKELVNISEEEMVRMISFLKTEGIKDLKNIRLIKFLSDLPPEKIKDFVSRLKHLFNPNIELQHLIACTGESAGATILLYEHFDEVSGAVQLIKEKLDQYFSLNYFEHLNRDVHSLLKISLNPEIISFIVSFKRQVNYSMFSLDDIPVLEELQNNPNTLTKIYELTQEAGYGFMGDDFPFIKTIINDDVLFGMLIRMTKAGYELKTGEEALPVIKTLIDEPEGVLVSIEKLHNRMPEYHFVPEDIEAIRHISEEGEFLNFILDFGKESKGKYQFASHDLPSLKNLFSVKDQVLPIFQKGDVAVILNHMHLFGDHIPTNIEGFIKVASEVRQSPSKEIQKIYPELMRELSCLDNPEFAWEQIKNIYEKNNLPAVVKINSIFEITHPPEIIEEKLKKNNNLSPSLLSLDLQEKYALIRRTLLMIHLQTGNDSLLNYLHMAKTGGSVFQKAEVEGLSSLISNEKTALEKFLDRMEILYVNTLRGRGRKLAKIHYEGLEEDQKLLKKIGVLKRRMGIKSGVQTFSERITELYLDPLGFRSIDEAIEVITNSKKQADERNRKVGETGYLELSADDLLKGSNSEYIVSQMQNGIIANEFLGNGSDSTPFDSDVAIVTNENLIGNDSGEKFVHAFSKSVSERYGDMTIVIRNRDQFQKTAFSNEQIKRTPGAQSTVKEDDNRGEIFYSGFAEKEQHWGILVGFPFTEVDAIIPKRGLLENKDGLKKIYYFIAQNGYYIPVLDQKGKVIFTPKDFEKYQIHEKELKDTLDFEEKLEPQRLITVLSQNEYLNFLFTSDAGVGEGWTVEEHTGMVLGQFEKYFMNNFSSPILSRRGMRFALAIHDIGKPLSIQKTRSTENQHNFTQEIVEPLIRVVGFSGQEADVILAVVAQDYIGEYLKYGQPVEAIAQKIKKKAEDLDVNPNDFFRILTMYYMSDASAYTSNAEYVNNNGETIKGKTSLDSLFDFTAGENTIELSSNTKTSFELLAKHFAS